LYNDPAELEAAQGDLRNAVEETIKPNTVVENPITHARGVIELEEHASEAQKVILDEMQMLRQRVAAVEALAAVSSKGPFFPSEREVLANALRPSASTHSKGILSDLFSPFPSEPSSLGNALRVLAGSELTEGVAFGM